MLVELGLVEQRYQAVREVLDHGASVTDVARRNGVSRQAVHEWLRKYANHGLAGLVDRSPKPQSCPHQMAPMVEARIVELRREHSGWGRPSGSAARGLEIRTRSLTTATVVLSELLDVHGFRACLEIRLPSSDGQRDHVEHALPWVPDQ